MTDIFLFLLLGFYVNVGLNWGVVGEVFGPIERREPTLELDGAVEHFKQPYFETGVSGNVTSVVGQTTQLHCIVRHVGDRTVSWIRKRDLHVLTSNIHTFTSDARFSVVKLENTDDWTLQIRYTQMRDAGIYECQVNTEPKMNMAVLLVVEAAKAKIRGKEEAYVKTGSTISLVCEVNLHSQPAASVGWYHSDVVVDFDSPRGGVSLETEKTETGTTSKLLITKATVSDSGNYTCVPSNADPDSVLVHVLNGEHPAAMQHGEIGVQSANTSLPSFLVLICAQLIHVLFSVR